jgi:DNA-binding NarL/FixJ family response regulator
LLKHEPDIEVVGEAETGRQAVQLCRKLHPAVVVMDIAMPLLNGLEATRQIRKEFPDIKVLILSAHSDDAYVEQVQTLGAAGFLLKQTSSEVLAKAIREVEKGNAYFSPSISQRLLTQWRGSLQKTKPSSTDATGLSRRQTEVFQLIAEGHLTKQIADILSLKLKTVEKHRESLMRKLDMHNIAALTRHAIFSGTIESGAGPDLGSVAA